MQLRFRREREFRIRSGDTFGNVDAFAGLKIFHAVTDRLNNSCSFHSRSVGKCGKNRVIAGACVSVRGIYSGSLDFDQHLSGRGVGRGDLFQLKYFRTAELSNENGFHTSSESIGFKRSLENIGIVKALNARGWKTENQLRYRT